MNGIRVKIFILVLVFFAVQVMSARSAHAEGRAAELFVGQDLYLAGSEVVSWPLGAGEYSLVFPDGFSMSIGGNGYSSGSAAVWFKRAGDEVKGTFYLCGQIRVEKSPLAATVVLEETVVEQGAKVIVTVVTGGEVFVTADKMRAADNRELAIYKEGISALSSLPSGPRFVVREEALVPQWEEAKKDVAVAEAVKEAEVVAEEAVEMAAVPAVEGEKVHYRYPVNLAPAGAASPTIEKFTLADGTEAATIIGRIYVWQKQAASGRLLELQADSAVVFYSGGQMKSGSEQSGSDEVLSGGSVQSMYMSGDVVLTEGPRTIRCDEVYYDFVKRKALATNSVFRTFDVKREIPIYVRAAKLRQSAANSFSAKDVTVTSSEFYKPQISLTIGEISIKDTTGVDAEAGKVSDKSFDAQMRNVRMKMGDTTVFRWPAMRSNLQRPDVPFKAIHFGKSGTWGTMLETEWYLSRLLGLQEPNNTSSSLNLDYYSKRGIGSGATVEYENEKYFGKITGYIIDDRGEDRLGRLESRDNLEPPRELRGRFQVQHRQFLPYNWQVTTEVGYLSDEHFLESYYRGEFDVYKKPETLVHLKRIEDNWGLSILGKGRINDFSDELEELPSVEYHRTGESLFNDTFTLYSDTGISRLRQRIGSSHSFAINEEEYSFASHRSELDLPLRFGTVKAVPYVAGTFGYDDRSGFSRSLVDGTNSGISGDDSIWLAEGGVRVGTDFWRVYPEAQSRLWDINGIRHVISPQLTGVFFEESDSAVRQHDMLNVGLSQRLQTQRGPEDKSRTVDWMRLDTEFTFVKDSESSRDVSTDRFIWNQPMVPLRVLSSPSIFNNDIEDGLGLERVERFGPRHNYFGLDYIWRVSDTFAVLSDGYYDMENGVFEQYNIGMSRLVWPNLSYYIGSRYLRSINVLDEDSSNSFVLAATYRIDPRYTLVLAQQYDFGFGVSMRSDVSLIRQYHRLFYGLTYSSDRSLDRSAIVFSIWPQGVPELGIGPRRYAK